MLYEKLLELVESKQLDITTVSLAEVTADFIDYLQKSEKDMNPQVLSEFISVAAKLILIKSRALLPNLVFTEEEKSEIQELKIRLVLYKQFKGASEAIKKKWREGERSFSRPLFMNLNNNFYPSQNINAANLFSSLARLSSEIEQIVSSKKIVRTKLVSIEEKMEELMKNLNQSTEQSLNHLVQNKSKMEIVVIFLALLHLIKNQAISIDKNQWIKIV